MPRYCMLASSGIVVFFFGASAACLRSVQTLLISFSAMRVQAGSEGEDIIDDNLGFSKERCISRLVEMQSLEYLIRHAKRHSPSLLLALEEVQQRSAGQG